MNRKIFFVGGVHGIGKTTLCGILSNKLSIPRYSASQLIGQINSKLILQNKNTDELETNQDKLITSIEKNIPIGEKCLLDGHFCLLNQSGKITDIPIVTFVRMSPCAIVVLKDDPKGIVQRIKNRDGITHSITKIANFQDREILYAEKVAEHMSIPYLIGNPLNEIEEIVEFIQCQLQ